MLPGPMQVRSIVLIAGSTGNALLDTEGGTLLRLVGFNFGRAGDSVVLFSGKPSLSTVYVSHRELQVCILACGLCPCCC